MSATTSLLALAVISPPVASVHFLPLIDARGFSSPRSSPPKMGGLTVSSSGLQPALVQPCLMPIDAPAAQGLPRIPTKALKLTKSFNPECSYTEPIATLWRDLETLYGLEGVVTGGSRTQIDSSRMGRGAKTYPPVAPRTVPVSSSPS